MSTCTISAEWARWDKALAEAERLILSGREFMKKPKTVYYQDIENKEVASVQDWLDIAREDNWDFNNAVDNGCLVKVIYFNNEWMEV